jgi:hypothetical protein
MLAGGGGKAQIDAAYRHLEGGRLAEAARDFEGAIKAQPAVPLSPAAPPPGAAVTWSGRTRTASVPSSATPC